MEENPVEITGHLSKVIRHLESKIRKANNKKRLEKIKLKHQISLASHVQHSISNYKMKIPGNNFIIN